jgi:hypothetical protein
MTMATAKKTCDLHSRMRGYLDLDGQVAELIGLLTEEQCVTYLSTRTTKGEISIFLSNAVRAYQGSLDCTAELDEARVQQLPGGKLRLTLTTGEQFEVTVRKLVELADTAPIPGEPDEEE